MYFLLLYNKGNKGSFMHAAVNHSDSSFCVCLCVLHEWQVGNRIQPCATKILCFLTYLCIVHVVRYKSEKCSTRLTLAHIIIVL